MALRSAGELTTLLDANLNLVFVGIVSTAAGWLIVSYCIGHTIWAIHITTGVVEIIDTTSAGKLSSPVGPALNESDRMCYIANQFGGYITAVTLPARYFTVIAGADAVPPVTDKTA